MLAARGRNLPQSASWGRTGRLPRILSGAPAQSTSRQRNLSAVVGKPTQSVQSIARCRSLDAASYQYIHPMARGRCSSIPAKQYRTCGYFGRRSTVPTARAACRATRCHQRPRMLSNRRSHEQCRCCALQQPPDLAIGSSAPAGSLGEQVLQICQMSHRQPPRSPYLASPAPLQIEWLL